MKLRLQTYSPVHIGSGNSLSAMDYVIEGTHYYRVTTTQFVDFLLSYNPSLVDLFSDWIIEQASLMEDLKYRRKAKEINQREKKDLNQQLSRAQQETNLRSFCKTHELESYFIKYLKSKAEDGEIVRHQLQSNRLNYNKGQVQEILSNSQKQFYIPGSSIKGAIRTALLFHAYMTHDLDIPDLDDNPYSYKERLEVGLDLELEDAIKEISNLPDRNKKRSKRREIAGYIGKDIEPFMSYGIKINEKGHKERRDVQQDVFKFLLISDAIPRVKSPAISVIKVDRYLLEKDRKSG
ncbi:MAG: type III-A CRISPR-associated RAMP protein Csm5, partial [Bacteroidota bacterium]